MAEGWIDPMGSWLWQGQKDGCAIGLRSVGALGVAGEAWGAVGCRTCGSFCHQHRAGAPPGSLLFLALSLGIGFQAGISRRAERGRGQQALLQLIPCALLFLVVKHGSGPSPALPRGLGVHAKGAPCHSKGCAPESLQFPVSLALHCQLF